MNPRDKALLNWTNARSDEQALDAVIDLAQQNQMAPQATPGPMYEAFAGLGVVEQREWDEAEFWKSVDEQLERLGFTREDLDKDE